jgi:hypothetical protein
MRRIAAALTLACMLMPVGASAQRQVQLTQDGGRILVNKDFAGERWAITYDEHRGSVTGNVLLANGGVVFIDCGILSSSGGELRLDCYSAGDSFWESVGLVTLPLSFFGIERGACRERRLTSGAAGWWYFTYADSCGHTGQGRIRFEPGTCRFTGSTYDADEVYAADIEVTVALTESDEILLQAKFQGACQGSAAGEGQVVRWREIGSDPSFDDLFQGTVRGSSTCCEQVEAQLGFRF